MPLLLIQRAFPEGLASITSHVTIDRTDRSRFSDGPSLGTVGRAALANGMAADSMKAVRVLDSSLYPSVAS